MRFVIGLLLASGFLVGGVAMLFPAFGLLSSEGLSEDTLASFTIAGFLLLIGVLLLFAVFKTRRKQRQLDADQMAAMGMAHFMTMDHGGDDGGAGGD